MRGPASPRAFEFVVGAGLLLAASRGARADDIPCQLVEPDVIHVDGLLDDWNDVAGLDIGGQSRDLSFTARCNHDAKTLYLSVDVRDDYLVRTPAAAPGEDHVELAFGDGGKVERLLIYPADGKVPRKVRWSSGRPFPGSPKGIAVADSRQPRGWSVEVSLPLRAVPGWAAGVPSVRLAVGVSDCDAKASLSQKSFLTTAPFERVETLGVVEFADSRATLDAFFKDRKVGPRDVVFDKVGRITAQGKWRVVVAGRYLALLSDEYMYLELPFRDRKDLLEVRLADLAGDGRDAIMVRYVERGGGGAREILAAYRLTGDGLRRTFGCEVAKSLGANRLTTKVSYVKKGKAQELLVEPLPAVGWTEATYHESPADDVEPIPLPWASKRARFQFRADLYTRGE